MIHYFYEITAFLFGISIGSFLNVCIYRIPNGKSIVHPGSTCPQCNTAIRFYDNIPILSYLFLLGKCRYCKKRISIRYPLIEFLTGLFAVCTYLKFGMSIDTFVYFIFIAALLTITFIDIDHQIIPNVISLPFIPIGIGLSFFLSPITVLDALYGVLAGGGSLFVVSRGYYYITRVEGLGLGDVKLIAMIGAFIGLKGIFFTIFFSSLIGTLIGTAVMIHQKKDMRYQIPYGPFLSIGAIVYLFFGNQIINWYIQFFAAP